MPELRILQDADAGRLEAFLVQHRDTSMFLRSNARCAGLGYAGRRLQATYVGGVQGGERVRGVPPAGTASPWLQPPAGAAALARRWTDVRRGWVGAVPGPAGQVPECRSALALDGARGMLEEDGVLYALDLDGWVRPPGL